MNAYVFLDKKPIRQVQKLKTLKKYVGQYQSGWKKRLELAELLYEMGRWPEAILELNHVIKAQPQLLNPRMQLGKILQLMNRPKEAILVYKSAIFLAKKEATKQHLIGLVKFCKGKTKSAIKNFELAATLEANNLSHWLALGQAQMDIENPKAALASFEKLLSLESNNLIGLMYSHDLSFALGYLQKADIYLKKAVEIASQDIQILKRVISSRCRKGLVLDAAGKQTKKLISDLLKQASSSPEAHNLLAQYYILRGECQKGLETLKRSSEEHCNNPYSWYYYSLCLFKLDQKEMATEAILKAYELSSIRRDCKIYQGLCRILPATGRLEKVRSIMAEMLEQFPDSWSLWATAGSVFVEYFKEFERGCNYSLHGTKLQPQLADVWFHHGRILSLAGNYKEAIAALTRGWQLLLPDTYSLKSVSAAIWLGESYQHLGCVQSGQKWLRLAYLQAEKLIDFSPDKARYWRDKALAGLESSADLRLDDKGVDGVVTDHYEISLNSSLESLPAMV
ncbi:MAG: hypothetical protein F6K42_10390 [Leptolyngbya sp. SIO1D8]|nr:hypothetical protein [Leptolyngbya sp. SIO1D8]